MGAEFGQGIETPDPPHARPPSLPQTRLSLSLSLSLRRPATWRCRRSARVTGERQGRTVPHTHASQPPTPPPKFIQFAPPHTRASPSPEPAVHLPEIDDPPPSQPPLQIRAKIEPQSATKPHQIEG